MPKFDFSSLLGQDSQEENEILKVQKSIITEKTDKILQPIKKIDIDFSSLIITQDDLWFLYRLKFGKGTRIKRRQLLPKFTDVFIKNLNELKK